MEERHAAADVLWAPFLLWLLLALLTALFWLGLAAGLSTAPVEVLTAVAEAALIGWFVRNDVPALQLFARARARWLEVSLLLGIVLWLAAPIYGQLVPEAWRRDHVRPLEAAGWTPFLILLQVAVLPGALEELAFRGFLLPRLQRVFEPARALVLQAGLFAVFHFDPPYLPWLFCMGLAFGMLRLHAGALWPCVLLHIVWNGAVVLQSLDSH